MTAERPLRDFLKRLPDFEDFEKEQEALDVVAREAETPLAATLLYRRMIDSLRQSLAGANEVASLRKDRAACAQEGLRPRTADFGLCVIDREDAVGKSH